MTHTHHSAYASWFFGLAILAFIFGVFFFAPNEVPLFKQQILAFLAALLAGLFGFFITGTLTVAIQHKESNTKLNAASGMALLVIVLGWWNSPVAPVTAAETEQQSAQQVATSETPKNSNAHKVTESQQDSSINAGSNLNIQGEAIVQTSGGQIQKGAKVDGKTENVPAHLGNSSINADGDITIGSNSVLQTGNGLIQKGE